MSVNIKTDAELIKILESSSLLLNKIELPNSATILDTINHYVSNRIPNSLDSNFIQTKFHNLQESIHSEFSTTYQKGKLIATLLSTVRKSLTNHQDNSIEIINNNLKIDKNERRMNSYRNLQLLKKMILAGATDDEDRLIGISYAYLSLVDGPYTTSLRDCYMWKRLSQNLPVNPVSVAKMSVSNILDFFRLQSLPLDYFDGWEKTVRNAVAHSSFKYEPSRQIMQYEDIEGSQIEHTFVEMVENYEKLENFYPAILSINQTLAINDVLNELMHRYR